MVQNQIITGFFIATEYQLLNINVKIKLQDRFFHDRDFFQTWDERLRCNFGLDAHHNANLAWQEVISKCLKRGCDLSSP